MSLQTEKIKEKIAIVVAHPDDEILWFSSILYKASKIIICFSKYEPNHIWTDGREKVINNYPLSTIKSLDLTESDVFLAADWRSPQYTKYGLKLSNINNIRDRYINNYNILKELLHDELVDFTTVYTHNPWGEYGHEEHVQIYTAVNYLQKLLGFNLFFDNYCSNRSNLLMNKWLSKNNVSWHTLETNIQIANQIKDLYKHYNCWTWFDNWNWFSTESYLTNIPVTENSINRIPLNYINVDYPMDARNCPKLTYRLMNRIRKLLLTTFNL